MYYDILSIIQSVLFGDVEFELWQQSFLAIFTITIITLFFVFIWKVISGFFRSIFRF